MRHIAILTLLLAILVAGLAEATMKKPTIDVAVEGRPRAAVAGESFEGVLKIRSQGDWELKDFRLSGEGWTVEALSPDQRHIVLKDDMVDFAFRAIPKDPAKPLLFEWRRDGIAESKSIDLSQEAIALRAPTMATRIPTGVEIDPGDLVPPPFQLHPMIEATGGYLPPDGSLPPGGAGANRPDGNGADPGDEPQVNPTTGLSADGALVDLVPILITGQIRAQQEESGQWYFLQDTPVSVYSSASPFPFTVFSDANGYFEATIYRSVWDWYPDIQVAFATGNHKVQVLDDGSWPYNSYRCFSEMIYDIVEDEYDVGTLTASGWVQTAGFYIAETIRRGWDHMAYGYSMDIPDVEVYFPDDEDSSHYLDNDISIARAAGYNEGTILHEYGHHWNDHFAYMPSHDYCNGICDEDVDDEECGHCIWCQENENVAWIEGIAQFFSRINTDHIKDAYWMPSDQWINEKQIHRIEEPDCLQMPQKTEGYFAAIMYDLADSDGPEDDPSSPGYADRVEGMDQEVFNILRGTCARLGARPHWAYDFLYCFKDANSSIREDVWETARNDWFFLDEADPELPEIIYSSHDPWVPSPDATIRIDWLRSEDDASGIEGYSISWSSPNQADPGMTVDIGNVTTVTSAPLSPAQYYFNIRPMDRDGNWADGYVTMGPFQIMPAEGADLRYNHPTGWEYEVVPRKTPDATSGDVQVSINLEGGVNNTYWNVAGINDGDIPSGSCTVSVYMDDTTLDTASWPYLGAGNSAMKLNQGPVTVPAGRHMFGMFLDSNEILAEQSESNNYRAGQWCWRPMTVLPQDQQVTFPAPTPVSEGWSYFGFEQPFFWNCDGHRTGSQITYQAVYMVPLDYDVDYDIRVFDQASLPEAGYLDPIGESTRPEGALDAVLWYGLNQGLDDCNIGVYNMDYDNGWATSQYRLERVTDTFIGQNYGRYEANLSATQMMEIWSIQSQGPATLKLTIATDYSPPIYMGYFSGDFVAGGLLDATEIAIATPGSPAVIEIDPDPGQICGVAVWRELDADLQHPELVYLDFELDQTDVFAQAPQGWYGPLVPRDDQSIPYPWDTMPAPGHLTGNTQSTYLYIGETNHTRVDAGEHIVEAHLDGAYLSSWASAGVPARGERKFTSASVFTVPGGRHTLSLWLDRDDDLDELYEDNNRYGRQWVWSTYDLANDVIRAFSAIADATGGWDEITDPPPGENPIHYNCSGVRTAGFDPQDGRFAIAYTICDDDNDVDLRIHPLSDGASDGFGQYEAQSSWREGEADFVVVDLEASGPRRFDLGLVEQTGSGGATVQTDRSGPTVLYQPDIYGPYPLERRDMVDLYQLHVRPGIWSFTVRQTDGEAPIDIGLSMNPATGGPYSTRNAAAHYGLLSWEAGRGEEERVLYEVYATTEVALAVWRSDRAETNVAIEYVIEWRDETSDVPGSGPFVPTVTQLLPAAPNPFGSETTLWFDLAEPSPVEISVFDAQGAVVFRHQLGLLAPGRHPFLWDGRQGAGDEAPSGIYFVRMTAAKQSWAQRVVRLR